MIGMAEKMDRVLRIGVENCNAKGIFLLGVTAGIFEGGLAITAIFIFIFFSAITAEPSSYS